MGSKITVLVASKETKSTIVDGPEKGLTITAHGGPEKGPGKPIGKQYTNLVRLTGWKPIMSTKHRVVVLAGPPLDFLDAESLCNC